MVSSVFLVGCTLLLSAGAAKDAAKRVIHTSWWPPGSEKTAESVGIVSYGFVYMTAMMELDSTLGGIARLELSDVSDIAYAGGVNVAAIVDCIINAPMGKARAVRKAFAKALSDKVNSSSWRPTMTVIEMSGEYPGDWFKASASCIAALPPGQRAYPRRQWSTDHAFGVSAQGLLHIQAGGNTDNGTSSQTASALKSMEDLVQTAGGSSVQNIADCLVFLQDIADAAAVRSALTVLPRVPAVTFVQAGLEQPGQRLLLRCVATVPKGPESLPVVAAVNSGAMVANNEFVYAPGQFGTIRSNGTDALQNLGEILSEAGTGLSNVVNCMFFMSDNNLVWNLFTGFFDVFNRDNPPPPTRGEFVGLSECTPKCFVVAKCVAALPLNQGMLEQLFV